MPAGRRHRVRPSKRLAGRDRHLRRLLILGGTSEAAVLARRLAGSPDIDATLSLAGRTRAPAAQPLPTRAGGFGGVEGLRRWLRDHSVDCVVDATHPFAARMSANAAAACAAEGVRRARFTRPPWRAEDGECWIEVTDGAAAVRALGDAPRRVFAPMGRMSLAPFAAAPWHFYLVRSVDPPGDLAFLPSHRAVVARPPFSREDERALLRDARIDVVVTKNSGGEATRAKLDAARDLGLPVIMIARPPEPPGPVFHHLEETSGIHERGLIFDLTHVTSVPCLCALPSLFVWPFPASPRCRPANPSAIPPPPP